MDTKNILYQSIKNNQDYILSKINLKSIFNQLNMGIMIIDKNEQIIYVNKAQSVMDDLSEKNVLGKSFSEIYKFRESGESIILKALKNGETLIDNTLIYRNPKGVLSYSLCSVFPLREKEKNIGSVCFIQRFGHIFSSPSPETKTKQANLKNTNLIGHHPLFLEAITKAKAAAKTPSPIFICGETGTGKEVFTRNIHQWSDLKSKPYVAINCAAIPHSLAESILFGTVKGSFTGALDSMGIFEQANGGLLFLDEIDSMPLELQPKLLRVLQEMKVRRVGSNIERSFEVKLVAAVGTTLEKLLDSKKMRMDLYYRLGVNVIEIPPLRDRLSDLQELINHFIVKLNYKLGERFRGVAPEVMEIFKSYNWPGNVRELEHVIESCMISASGLYWISKQNLPKHFFTQTEINIKKQIERENTESENLEINSPTANKEFLDNKTNKNLNKTPKEIPQENIFLNFENIKQLSQNQEIEAIKQALTKTYGNITLAASELGISRQLLHHKLKKYNIDRLSVRN